ncbi:MAG: type II secretion system protein [Gammaproteobacteria bacterium]|nr:type II secretion system protein [Gammaproteobacteria bacterium]
MKAVTQQGFTFPEVLAALAIVGLAIGLIGSFAGARIDAGKIHVKWTESRYIASLAARAHRNGLLTGDVATAADLQTALPHLSVPARLGDGQTYRVALDGADPRILIDGETEAVRVPFPASELRIPLWRARRLRQIRQGTE